MPFKKGQIANPKGAPRKSDSAAFHARKHTHEAIETLVTLMRSDKEDIRHKGAIGLLERGWGKPKEHVELTGEDGGPITTLGLSDSAAWVAGLLRTREETPSSVSGPH